MFKRSIKRATIEEIENILDNKVKIEPIKCNNKTINCSDKIALYEQMAMDNVLYATNILGLLYDNGEDNIEVNKQKSKELYIKAAKLGLAKAQYNLGVLYKKEKDYKNAFIWFLEASKQQHQRAQYNLGIFYEDGLGTTKNLEKSKYWYKQSAINGYKLAYTHL